MATALAMARREGATRTGPEAALAVVPSAGMMAVTMPVSRRSSATRSEHALATVTPSANSDSGPPVYDAP